MHVKILDIDNPSSFWIKETPGCGMSEEAKVFQALHTEINSYFDDNISLPCIKRPEQGKVRNATLGSRVFQNVLNSYVPSFQQHLIIYAYQLTIADL